METKYCPIRKTPETDAIWEDYINPPYNVSSFDLADFARKMERDRNELHAWAMQAVPMLSKAACIVIDNAAHRLDEIEGVRGVLETCPVDFTNPENA